jgi:hypothetical protein
MLNKIFSIVWKKRLWDDYHKYYKQVIKVKGWRTALICDQWGGRETVTFLFNLPFLNT